MALNHLILGTLRSLFTIGVRNLMPISQFSLSKGATTDSRERIMSNFDFGGGEGSDYALSKMNDQKLEKAPIHNLNAERSVGFINYELHRRGAKQLACASSSQVKAKSH